MHSGPDPDFPFLDESRRFRFPLPGKKGQDSIIAGGNLSPGMLLSGYEQGYFPWYSEGEPILWHSPDPRFVIFPDKLHISKSMKKVLRQGQFKITFDRDFEGVIRTCAAIDRPGQDSTWITADMIEAYIKLHALGWAHSAETYAGGELAGGCYGVRLGNVFFAESMFAKKTNASKAALLTLAQQLFDDGVKFIDSQVHTPHVESLGGQLISRMDFLKLLVYTQSDI